ncbi:hypothetical protein LA66_08905 [Aureimonas altamirensis]|uniref:Nickel import system ATP-binding protein NikD n=1 Tax=Aureimonas altamirensis TaxID=370622 RepID=A0A0B1Q7A6_9HYPH|nr:ATP-binding cassette domain-containing protein [Aureimonas altamirensis]KHJ54695.1 hypothetical protein LA66_08905 [Aureimonas altamirensis]
MIEAQDLAIHMDGRRLVSGVSFTVDPGRVLALAGESGIGKSLVAAALVGMLPGGAQRGGTLFLDGQVMTDACLRAVRGRRIALAPQPLSSLDPSARVDDQFRWAARRAGLPRMARKAAAAASLARLGLAAETCDLYPHHLSGGMARRVLVGIATVGRPQVLIVDEPTSGLDGASIALVAGDLRRLASDGCAVIVITHDLVFASRVADAVAVLSPGGFAAPMPASAFTSDGADIPDAHARRLWRATPANGMTVDA